MLVTGFVINVKGTLWKRGTRWWYKLCQHRQRPSRCKPCGGSGICKHDKRQDGCIKCGGSSICEHKRERTKCKECGGSGRCEHDRLKSECRDCGGASVCEHGRQRTKCKDCHGASICEHNRLRYSCTKCDGGGICEHQKVKHRCKECGGNSICEHKRRRCDCKDCHGSSICEHGRRKTYCVPCEGWNVCKAHKETLCGTLGSHKYDRYCARCYTYLFPDKPMSKFYCTKEHAVLRFVNDTFPDFTIISNKAVLSGCSKRRPDILIDFGSHVVVIEVDEHQHDSKSYNCEERRMLEIMQDAGMRPIVFIRFNPDDYTDSKGEKTTSCWGYSSHGMPRVNPNKIQEWSNRLETLRQVFSSFTKDIPTKDLTIVQLFYSACKDDENDSKVLV